MSGSKIKISNRDLEREYNAYLSSKSEVITQLYEEWGERLVEVLKKRLPGLNHRNLKSRLKYKVYSPRNKDGLIKYITLTVGLITKQDKLAVPYIKYILNGVKPHFVPIKTRSGKETGILDWALDHKLVYYDSKGRLVWRKNRKTFRGLFMHGFYEEPYFDLVYNDYADQIRRQVLDILEG